MLCSRWLKPQHGEKHGRIYRLFEGMFEAMQSLYGRTLGFCLTHRRWVAGGFAAVLALTLRGTPVLYMGEEIGMIDTNLAGIPELDRAGRDGARTPMHWTDEPGVGFTTGRPWLPAGDAESANVRDQSADPGSLLNLYRRLVRLRASSSALSLGSYRAIDVPAGAGVFAFLRESGDERYVVAIRVGDGNSPVDLVTPARGRIERAGVVALSSADRSAEGAQADLRALELGPNEAAILRL